MNVKAPVRVKVCGITRTDDVRAVLQLGADYVGINLYRPSLRSVSLEQASKLLERIPQGRRVLVDVAPSVDVLKRYARAGFDYFQLHFDVDSTPMAHIAQWAAIVGRERLWLAPRLPSMMPLPNEIVSRVAILLIDTYHKGGYGGSGKTGDWGRFRKLQAMHPTKIFILAGGLGPDNIECALTASEACFVDVNSGVESAPGIKSSKKLRLLFQRLKRFLQNARSLQP